MADSLTLVLPVHNAEATLSRQVDELLAIAGELTSQFELLVIDDGSDDDTFEVASELATRFPQIRVTRHGVHRGLGPTLRSLRGRLKSDVVIVQDGGSLLDAAQVRRLWNEKSNTQFRIDGRQQSDSRDISVTDLRTPSRIHPAMEAAHRRLGRRELLQGSVATDHDESGQGISWTATIATDARRKQSGVGRIPQLPAAGIFGSLTEFARSE